MVNFSLCRALSIQSLQSTSPWLMGKYTYFSSDHQQAKALGLAPFDEDVVRPSWARLAPSLLVFQAISP